MRNRQLCKHSRILTPSQLSLNDRTMRKKSERSCRSEHEQQTRPNTYVEHEAQGPRAHSLPGVQETETKVFHITEQF